MAKCLLNFHKDLHFILNIEQKERKRDKEGRKRKKREVKEEKKEKVILHTFTLSV